MSALAASSTVDCVFYYMYMGGGAAAVLLKCVPLISCGEITQSHRNPGTSNVRVLRLSVFGCCWGATGGLFFLFRHNAGRAYGMRAEVIDTLKSSRRVFNHLEISRKRRKRRILKMHAFKM